MKSVEMHDAWMFTCPDCGLDTFVRAVARTSEEVFNGNEEDARKALKLQPWEDLPDGCWLSHPDEVTCEKCGVTLRVEDDK